MQKRWAELFGTEEWSWIVKLGSSFTDPEQKKAFWDTAKDKKLADPNYSIFTDFPKEFSPKPEDEPGISDKARMARRYCGEILEVLKHGKRGSA